MIILKKDVLLANGKNAYVLKFDDGVVSMMIYEKSRHLFFLQYMPWANKKFFMAKYRKNDSFSKAKISKKDSEYYLNIFSNLITAIEIQES